MPDPAAPAPAEDWAKRLNDEPGLGRTLGIVWVMLTPKRVVAELSITPALHQPHGYLHGGVSVALAETVASVGASLNCPPDQIAFGMEINANHLRPKKAGILTAVGTPLHRGRTSQVWDIRISDEAGKLVCISRCTVAIMPVSG